MPSADSGAEKKYNANETIQASTNLTISAKRQKKKANKTIARKTHIIDSPEQKKSLKRKRQPAPNTPDVPPIKKPKTHPNTTDFPDPDEDATLNDQARKALAYAFAQFNDPHLWKFNKARQNWLLRNFWSSTQVPEPHVTLVTKYLTNVKGRVRETLIKSCSDSIRPPDPASVPAVLTEETEPALPTLPPVVDESRRNRARAVLNALGIPEPVVEQPR